ncbi:DUF1997 domain-containing protein [Roseofilum capinflatum]|uniref:DUF1997 domain-containing protein n=1 Tax=Roseofilum capinflatum BLCC-M114 TaxID=3022440 RepID=A0ABT7B1K9_9CYAN|nr:DUF1997 domain-containing protein [Roseofilum capinflatum]MDJ1173056.1 DUF1997 domain-containing protein [Roseofilum capinflatum BLCC-M114]
MTDACSQDSGSENRPSRPEQSKRSPKFGDRFKALSSKVSQAMGFEWMYFHLNYADCVELYAPEPVVAEYVNDHPSWFTRCALPMKAIPIGDSGYDLLLGRYGALQFEVEVRIGLQLIPRDEAGVYRISSIDLPDYTPPGYEVNFHGQFYLAEVPCCPTPEYLQELQSYLILPSPLPEVMTRWEWSLDLTVGVKFPHFIHRLPQSLIQSTSDRLLQQIVREVSRRLGKKVQQDFHQTLSIRE